MQKSVRLIKILDGLYFSDNAHEDGISVRIGLAWKNMWRLNFRFTCGFWYEDSDTIHNSFETCVEEAMKLLAKRWISLIIN